ncbi:MAG: ATP-dependent DNA helicase RecQ, partial [Acidobacteriota bacterium]
MPTGSAAESELHDRRLEAELRRHFGFESFRRGQRPVIEALLAGRSAAAVFPTGGGKSLCYQLPALLLDGLTVVVSPLLALMKDQVDALVARGLPAARLDSSLTADEVRAVRERLRAGSLRLLYVSPERFANERFRSLLEHLSVALFAVDEAHCISEWGHNFRPDYLKLPRTARALGAERVLALTATATPDVLEDICRSFEIAPGDAVRTGVYRPNLSLRTTPVARGARDAALLEHVAQRPPGAGIVYVTLQKTAERVADLLRAARHEAMAYHAGLDAETRSRIQDEFLASDRALVVATIAFGMGIDKPNIRSVDHYDLPKSLENWSQEIGRAGRDGEPAICRVFGSIDDLVTLSNFAYGDTPSREAVRSLLDEVLSRNAEQALALVSLSRRVDIRPLVLRTLLTYLELDGVLEIGTPRYATYRFRPLASSAEILARFDGARRELLRGIFRRARKARTWFDLDLETVASELDQPRERIVGALDHLAERQLFELRATDLRQIVRRRGPVDDLEWLADSLH